MAILAISRQMSSVEEELIKKIADILGCKYIDRKMIRERMEKNGFPAEKFNKYDEIRPSFSSFFSKDRENYIHYLREAILNECEDANMNCVFAGRGAFQLLKDIPSCVSVRFVADGWTRLERAKAEFNIDSATAKKKLFRSEMNKYGYYKIYFKLKLKDNSLFDLVIDTTKLKEDEIIKTVVDFVKNKVTPQDEFDSKRIIGDLILGQIIVNILFNAYDVNVTNLEAVVSGRTITLTGVTDTSGTIEYVKKILACELPQFEVVSHIEAVQDSMSRSRR